MRTVSVSYFIIQMFHKWKVRTTDRWLKLLDSLAPAKFEHQLLEHIHRFPTSDCVRRMGEKCQTFVTGTHQVVEPINLLTCMVKLLQP